MVAERTSKNVILFKVILFFENDLCIGWSYQRYPSISSWINGNLMQWESTAATCQWRSCFKIVRNRLVTQSIQRSLFEFDGCSPLSFLKGKDYSLLRAEPCKWWVLPGPILYCLLLSSETFYLMTSRVNKTCVYSYLLFFMVFFKNLLVRLCWSPCTNIFLHDTTPLSVFKKFNFLARFVYV